MKGGNSMKTFQLDNEPNRLCFTNYNKIDEEVLFQNIFKTLKNCKDIEIGRKHIGPSEDLYDCKLSDFSFTLVYDIDYGTYIQVDDVKIIPMLETLFEVKNG